MMAANTLSQKVMYCIFLHKSVIKSSTTRTCPWSFVPNGGSQAIRAQLKRRTSSRREGLEAALQERLAGQSLAVVGAAFQRNWRPLRLRQKWHHCGRGLSKSQQLAEASLRRQERPARGAKSRVLLVACRLRIARHSTSPQFGAYTPPSRRARLRQHRPAASGRARVGP